MSDPVINILAIESSCDDTAASVIQNGAILCNLVAGQKIHESWGGVVPELASRAHQQHIVPLVHEALRASGVSPRELSAVAFTAGPGLIGSLLVGVSFAKAFALGLSIPLISVNHMQAHILAHFIREPHPSFPFLCLTVSGGHTTLTVVKDHFDYEVIGRTQDDAAGEAFDKAAKILGLPYPGGPLIDKHARNGNPGKFSFPHPHIPAYNFSFSGLKTAYLYFVRDHVKADPDFIQKNLDDICASVQHSINVHLMKKLVKAAEDHGIRDIAIAGGVSANSGLRGLLEAEGKKRGWRTFIPDMEYCTDNAAMIAITAHYKYLKGMFAEQSTTPYAR